MSERDGVRIAVKISVHEETDDETGEERYIVHDDGGEFDPVEISEAHEVQGDVDERRAHYKALGFEVVGPRDHAGRWS